MVRHRKVAIDSRNAVERRILEEVVMSALNDKSFWIKNLISEGLSDDEIVKRMKDKGFVVSKKEVQAIRSN
jgi:hypothetical protein